MSPRVVAVAEARRLAALSPSRQLVDALNTVPVVVANDALSSLRNLVRELRDKELALLVHLASLRAGEPERSNQRWWVDSQLDRLLSAWAELSLWAREAQLERGETERAAEEAAEALQRAIDVRAAVVWWWDRVSEHLGYVSDDVHAAMSRRCAMASRTLPHATTKDDEARGTVAVPRGVHVHARPFGLDASTMRGHLASGTAVHVLARAIDPLSGRTLLRIATAPTGTSGWVHASFEWPGSPKPTIRSPCLDD